MLFGCIECQFVHTQIEEDKERLLKGQTGVVVRSVGEWKVGWHWIGHRAKG